MNKDQALNYIRNAMGLRKPQSKSLELFADYLESDAGKALLNTMKKSDRKPIGEIESRAIGHFSGVKEGQNFEGFDDRAYPTFTYALATGVGKTRLMGAFVTYLYLVYGIQHFMIVAPGNTIYRKLVDDFSKSNNKKYVFKGIEELNTSTVNVITKDNYAQSQSSNLGLYKNKIEINILNVQQFAQKDIEQQKGITKGSEIFGVEDGKLLSYFDYLAGLDDLVVLLDESHHYHADAAFQSLDRLAPLMGLEFTATPYTGVFEGRGAQKRPVMKQSIVYLYNLGDAIRDGYVKDPWIGTEADVDLRQFGDESIESDLRKLQLAVFFHERAKMAIQEYSLSNDVSEVKPVMLVVAQNIQHAEDLKSRIDSTAFRGGLFKGKVLVIHTSLRGEESETAIEQLVSLEDPNNSVEVVIHVNMLKEGWDVANIYTIVPLRSSAAQILTEQTIGRGLRLPYGNRTGVPLVDRVVIVAHEQFDKVVAEARNSSLIQPTNIEQVSGDQVSEDKKLLAMQPVLLERIEDTINNGSKIKYELRETAEINLAHLFSDDTSEEVKTRTIEDLTARYVVEAARSIAEGDFADNSLFGSLSGGAKEEIQKITMETQNLSSLRNISIPRLVVMPQYGKLVFNDFDLDTSKLEKYKANVSIIEQKLQGSTDQTPQVTKASSFTGVTNKKAENILVEALDNEPLVDYDEQKNLLMRLVSSAVSFYRVYNHDESTLLHLVETHAREISTKIYEQMLAHKTAEDGYTEPIIREPKHLLEPFRITQVNGELPVSLESQSNSFSRNKIYSEFKKACHSSYTFDSSDEVRFAYLLERGSDVVVNWLRPAPKQFEGLYWRDEHGNSQHTYETDFVVELNDEVVLVEVKPASEVSDFEVRAKKQTAEKYCEIVNKNIGKFGISKPWKYVIVPTEKITLTATVGGLLSQL